MPRDSGWQLIGHQKRISNEPERLPPFFALCPLRGYMSEEKIRTGNQTDETTELSAEALEQISGGAAEEIRKHSESDAK
jgi:hypothetical protein